MVRGARTSSCPPAVFSWLAGPLQAHAHHPMHHVPCTLHIMPAQPKLPRNKTQAEASSSCHDILPLHTYLAKGPTHEVPVLCQHHPLKQTIERASPVVVRQNSTHTTYPPLLRTHNRCYC